MNERRFRRRVYVTGSLLAVTALLFVVHLTRLHFSDRITIPPPERPDVRRGSIKDRNGYILALSIVTSSCYANPSLVRDPAATAAQLAPYLNTSRERLVRLLSLKRKFIWLERKLDDATARAIEKLDLEGIYFRREYRRVYPYGTLAANIIGFAGLDNKGLEGIEYRFNRDLNGVDSRQKETAVVYGNDIKLTIDRFVQDLAEKELALAVNTHQAKQGAVVVMDTKTGEILALAKVPGFDPNRYGAFSDFQRRSFSVIDSFEPGSTMKIMTTACIMENRPALLKYKYECRGKIDIAGETIHCTGVHGIQDFKDIIRHSCNVGTVLAARGITNQQLYDTLKKFNFGERVSDDLPGEAPGILRPPDQWSGMSRYAMAIGHEMSVNSLQLTAAFASLAQGIYHYPVLVHSIRRYDGTVVRDFYPRTRGRVLQRKHCVRLLEYMRRVVSPGGTGRSASTRYYEVSGKTGTSRKFSFKEGTYSKRVVSSFVGLAPYPMPRLAILVVVDEPIGGRGGGTVAAPVFARILHRVGPYLGIVQTGVAATDPLKHVDRPIRSGSNVPDFRGMELYRALDLVAHMMQKKNIRYQVYGSGTVIQQKPGPGTPLGTVQQLVLYCGEKKQHEESNEPEPE